jgi:hypothetical protein
MTSFTELLDTISAAAVRGNLPGVIRYFRLRLLHEMSKLDTDAQVELVKGRLSESAIVAGAFDLTFTTAEPTAESEVEA